MISLDDMLTPDQAADWLQVSRADLLDKSKGLRPQIPVARIGHKTLRYSPRIIIAHFAADCGVLPEIIAASLNLKLKI